MALVDVGQFANRLRGCRVLALAVTAWLLFLSEDHVLAQPARSGPTGPSRSVTVATEPNAGVWLDGILYGKTDTNGRLTIKHVSGGAHTLRVRAAGFKEASKPLTAGQSGELPVALARTTDEAELAFQQGETLTSVDRQKAAAAFKKAIALRPNYIDAQIALARVYSDAGDFDNAMKAVRAARKVKPGVAEISAIEGRLYKDSGDEAKAIASFKRAITEGKGFQPEAYTGLGILYKDRAENVGSEGDLAQEAANYREAVKYLSAAVKQLGTAPDGIVVYQLLGLVYEKQKKYKEAIALYEEFLCVYPDSAEATAVQSFITQIKKQMAEQPE
jgi:tetratricopeptide (TPR) repeat protein